MIPEPEEEDKVDSDITEYHLTVSDAGQRLLQAVREDIETCEETLRSARAIRAKWETRKAEWDKEFDEFLKTAGGEQEALTRQRTRLQRQLRDLRNEREELLATASQLQKCSTEREDLLDRLDQARRNL